MNLRHVLRALAVEIGDPVTLRAWALDRAKFLDRASGVAHARPSRLRRRRSLALWAWPIPSDDRVSSELRRRCVSLVTAGGGGDDGLAEPLHAGNVAVALPRHCPLDVRPLEVIVGPREGRRHRRAVLDGAAFTARRRLPGVFVFECAVASTLEAHL